MKLYGLRAAAKMLGVSYQWIDRAARADKIKVVWLGGKRMIRREEIDRIMQEGVR